MSDLLPQEIQVSEIPGGVHYRLPRRQLGGLRHIGLAMLVLGLGCAGLGMYLALARDVLLMGNLAGLPDGVVLALSVLVGLVLLVPSFAVVRFGAFVFAGHSEIAVCRSADGDGRLDAIEKAGPFRRTRWRTLAGLVRLRVVGSADTPSGQASAPAIFRDLAALRADSRNGKPLWLAIAYPRNLLVPLANELASRCGLATGPSAVGDAPPLPVVEEKGQLYAAAGGLPMVVEGNEEVPQRPATARATLEEHPEGVTLTVAPAGVWHGSRGLFVFSLVWCGFMSALTAGLIVALVVQAGVIGNLCLIIPFLLFFWLVGIATLLGAINMGRRRAVLAVVGETLMVLQTGIFGGIKKEWVKGQLASVHVGPSGMKVNDVPVLNLQIHARDASVVGLLTGHGDEELEWMAAILRKALQLPRFPNPPAG
jgi:hypothetical protein